MERARIGLLGLVLVAGGCGGGVYLSDDEGGPRHSSALLADHADELSLPYAAGTTVRIEVKDLDDRNGLSAWRAESSNTAVFSVDKAVTDSNQLVFECTARGAGEARLVVRDNRGGEARTATITVAVPDRARVFSHASLRILGLLASSFDPAEVSEARVLAGGTAVYAIGYFQGTRRVFGRGLLQTEVPAGVMAESRTTTGMLTNEWLFLKPASAVAGELRLRSGQTLLATLPLAAVDSAAATALALRAEETKGKKPGEDAWLWAAASDAQGRTIEGGWSGWTLDGVAQVGKDGDSMKTRGDLFRFTLSSGAPPREVVASLGALQARTSVAAEKAWVSDSTYLGCSTGRRGGPATASLSALALLGLALVRRRRPR